MKTAQRPTKSHKVSLPFIICMAVVAIVSLILLGYKTTTTEHHLVHCNTSCYQNWKTYLGSTSGVSFKYPDKAQLTLTSNGTKTEAAEAVIPADKLSGYQVYLGRQFKDDYAGIEYSYSTAVSDDIVSNNLSLDVRLWKVPYSRSRVSLAHYPNALVVKTFASGKRYVIFQHVEDWNAKTTNLAECDVNGECTRLIATNSPNTPYAEVSIHTIEGWRHSYAKINYNSKNYHDLIAVMQSLTF